MKSSIFGLERDIDFMQKALQYAQYAYEKNEVPIGAVIVDEHGDIIAGGSNQVEELHTQGAHAESRAVESAGRARLDWRLDGCWLYVTLEPCAMCMSLIKLSRLAGVVFAASSPLFGYRLDKDEVLSVYNRHLLTMVEGVCDQQASVLLKMFFQKKRNKRE